MSISFRELVDEVGLESWQEPIIDAAIMQSGDQLDMAIRMAINDAVEGGIVDEDALFIDFAEYVDPRYAEALDSFFDDLGDYAVDILMEEALENATARMIVPGDGEGVAGRIIDALSDFLGFGDDE